MRSTSAARLDLFSSIYEIALTVALSCALMFFLFSPRPSHAQEDNSTAEIEVVKPTAEIKIVKPTADNFKADQRVWVKGTAILPAKAHLWLVVKHIKKDSKKPIYLHEVKEFTLNNEWKHKIELNSLNNELDLVKKPAAADGQPAINAVEIKLEIFALIVNESEHSQLKKYWIAKRNSEDWVLKPTTPIAKDKTTINVQY